MPSLRYQVEFLRGLLSGGHAYTPPKLVVVDLTRRCNLRCPGCRYHSQEVGRPGRDAPDHPDMSPALLVRLCDQLEELGVRELVFTGSGEPTLHPALIEMVSGAAARRFRTTLFTNGTRLDEALAGALIGSGLDVITISLWASTEEVYRRCYPGTDPAMFHQVIDGTRALVGFKRAASGRGPTLRLYHPINRNNHAHLDELAALAAELDVDELHLSPFRTRRGKLDSLGLSTAEERRTRRALRRVRRKLHASAIGHNVEQVLYRYWLGEDDWRRVPCYAGFVQAWVKPDGAVTSCNSNERMLGTLEQQRFEEIWNGPPFTTLRRELIGRDADAPPSGVDCDFCGQLPDNRRVYRRFMWFEPLARHRAPLR